MTAECRADNWAGLTDRVWTRPLSPGGRCLVAAGSLRRAENEPLGVAGPSPSAWDERERGRERKGKGGREGERDID